MKGSLEKTSTYTTQFLAEAAVIKAKYPSVNITNEEESEYIVISNIDAMAEAYINGDQINNDADFAEGIIQAFKLLECSTETKKRGGKGKASGRGRRINPEQEAWIEQQAAGGAGSKEIELAFEKKFGFHYGYQSINKKVRAVRNERKAKK